MSEDIHQLFDIKEGYLPEYLIAIKTSITAKDMTMWIKSEEISKCLHDNNRPGTASSSGTTDP